MQDDGIDDDGAGGSSSADDDGTGPAPVSCDEGLTCAAFPAEGWFGPVARRHVDAGASPPSCPEPIGQAGPVLAENFTVPAATECDCDCAATGLDSCNGVVTLDDTEECSCDGGCDVEFSENCVNVEVPGFAQYINLSDPGGIACAPAVTATIPEVAPTGTMATCGIAGTAATCDGGVCMPPIPEGFEGGWCIHREGELDCPPGPYSEQIVVWGGLDDTRGCSECMCGDPPPCASTLLQVFAEPDCEGMPVTTVPNVFFGCSAAEGMSLRGVADCVVEDSPSPIGAVVPRDPVTFCCAQG
jgi:hypothetical protein